MGQDWKQVMVRFAPETHAKLVKEAERLGVPPAVFVRTLVKQLLDKPQSPTEPPEWPEGFKPSRAERRRSERNRRKGA